MSSMFPISTVGHSKVKLAISSFSCPGYPGYTDTSEPQLFHKISRYGVLRPSPNREGPPTASPAHYLELSVLDIVKAYPKE